MAARTKKANETEQVRRQLLRELNADESEWKEENKPGSFGCHELLDRTHLLAGLIEHQVLTHPACVCNAEWFALANKAATALQELYRQVGAEHLGHAG